MESLMVLCVSANFRSEQQKEYKLQWLERAYKKLVKLQVLVAKHIFYILLFVGVVKMHEKRRALLHSLTGIY